MMAYDDADDDDTLTGLINVSSISNADYDADEY